MDWLAREPERRATPEGLWPDARTAIVVAMNYGPAHDPLAVLDRPDRAAISVYAQNRDYHDVMKGKLKELAGWLHRTTGEAVKVFVDTAPLLEKPLAERAGIGWQGKHTNLVSRAHGSWLFLGEILTAATLDPDPPETDHCGSCRRCLDVCPTDAFPALPARCPALHLLPHDRAQGPDPARLPRRHGQPHLRLRRLPRRLPLEQVRGVAREAKLVARDDLRAPRLDDLLRLDDPAFRRLFSGSPIKRIGRDRFLRNVLIAAGNSGDAGLLARIEPLLADPSALVRGAAVWAFRRLAPFAMVESVRAAHLPGETDPEVRDEWLR
jgi:epoxyqueuosine reductase